MKTTALLSVLIIALLSLSACTETVKGLGKDMNELGKKIEKSME